MRKLIISASTVVAIAGSVYLSTPYSSRDQIDVMNPPTDSATETLAVAPLAGISSSAKALGQPAAVVSNGRQAPNVITPLVSCYYDNGCRQSGTDPRQKHFELAQEIISALHTQFKPSNASIASTGEMASLHTALSFPDGKVKSEAVAIISNMPVKQEMGKAIIASLANEHDAAYFASAMAELQRYESLADDSNNVWLTTLRTGPHFAAQIVAKNISSFLSSKNIHHYEEALASLPKNSDRAQLLAAAINDFKLRQSGG